jgi:hypothetical protein
MGKLASPAAQLLRPLLDMYMDSAVAVTGCHAAGFQRNTCELDVLVVGKERRSPASVKLGGVYMDIVFLDEKEALNPSNPEHAASLATATPVRDTSLVLSTSSAAGTAVLSDTFGKCARGRLGSAVKALGRADGALAAKDLRETGFWLLSATYDFARGLLYSKETLPSPSHLLRQMREQSRKAPGAFEAFSGGAGLGRSSKQASERRLEAIAVLHDILRTRSTPTSGPERGWSDIGLEILRQKSSELGLRIEHSENYSFLGQEVVDDVMQLAAQGGSKRGPKVSSDKGELVVGGERLLGGRLVEDLGLVKEAPSLEASLKAVNEQVSALARGV